MITTKDIEELCAKGKTEQDRKDIYEAAMMLVGASRQRNHITHSEYKKRRKSDSNPYDEYTQYSYKLIIESSDGLRVEAKNHCYLSKKYFKCMLPTKALKFLNSSIGSLQKEACAAVIQKIQKTDFPDAVLDDFIPTKRRSHGASTVYYKGATIVNEQHGAV